MSSNVFVVVNDLNTMNVKTTPAMSLKEIKDTVCSKHKLDPDTYGLKYRKDMLDLSLSVRFASLPPGAKLELIRQTPRDIDAVRFAQVAIQLESGTRIVLSLSTDTTLWSMLEQAEQTNSGLTITKYTDVPKQINDKKVSLKSIASQFKLALKGSQQRVYYLPVCLFMNREINSLPSLMQTSLKDLGVTGGNVLIRVLWRETDISLEEAMALVASLSSPSQTEPHHVVEAPKTISSQPLAPKDVPSLPSSEPCPTESSVSNTSMFIEKQPEKDPEPLVLAVPADRNVKVLFPSAGSNPQKFDLPDSFFDLSGPELMQAMQGATERRKYEEDRPLMTKAMRDKIDQEKERKYPKTMIRIRFSDRILLQGEFMTSEKVSAIYAFVKSHLKNPSTPFTLYTTPPMNKFESPEQLESNLYRAKLAPASLMNVNMLAQDCLNPSLLKHAETARQTEQPVQNSSPQTMSHSQSEPSNANASGSGGISKLPKWFKMGGKK